MKNKITTWLFGVLSTIALLLVLFFSTSESTSAVSKVALERIVEEQQKIIEQLQDDLAKSNERITVLEEQVESLLPPNSEELEKTIYISNIKWELDYNIRGMLVDQKEACEGEMDNCNNPNPDNLHYPFSLIINEDYINLNEFEGLVRENYNKWSHIQSLKTMTFNIIHDGEYSYEQIVIDLEE